MDAKTCTRIAAALATTGLLAWASPASAFRMIQNVSTGRVTAGSQVTCDDTSGFAHWGNPSVTWYLNQANQGSGKATAVQSAMTSWNNVTSASQTLSYGGTTTDGWATDGRNTLMWDPNNGCTGGCLALTALVLTSGQVIVETDITFNNGVTWTTNGSNYDTETVAAHELGHSLGLHHTEVASTPHPTMYTPYFDSGGRSLESDDQDGLRCSEDWYISPTYTGTHSVTNCREISGTAQNSKRPSGTTSVSIYNGASLLTTIAANGAGHSFNYTPTSGIKDGQSHTINVKHTATGANLTGTGQSLICHVSGLPGSPASFIDTLGQTWSVGNVFHSSIAGYVTHLRYYRAAEETGVHTLRLYTSGGTKLGEVTFDFGGDATAGWETGQLSSPIAISASTDYVAAATTLSTRQSKTDCGFSSPISNGPLTFTGGRWVQGTDINPTTGSCSNFWTDVYFDQ